jgi:hypothetical protein
MDEKKCRTCGLVKPLKSFALHKRATGRLQSRCRTCQKIYSDEWYSKNKSRQKASVQKWRNENRESLRSGVLSQYGMSVADYEKMFLAQGGKCAVCGEKEIKVVRGGVRNLVVDHCHSAGHVRGLLCGNCNLALGLFKDDVSLLLNAIQYLSRNARKVG